MDTEPYMIVIWARRGCQPVRVSKSKHHGAFYLPLKTQLHGSEYVEVDTEDKQDSALPRFPELF